jgi:hypothetical protein
MAFLSVLLFGGGYTSYIASFQTWVLFAATAIFALLVLCDALFNTQHAHDHDHHDHDHGTPVDHWIQTLVHGLPIFLFLAIGTTSLGSHQIVSLTRPAPSSVMNSQQYSAASPATSSKNPVTKSTDGQEIPNKPTTPFTDGPTPAELINPTLPGGNPLDDPVVANAPVLPLPLMELYYPKKHPGVMRVETIGRLMIPSPAELEKVPPEMDRADLKLLLYRYVMTCCAADAAPVFVVLKNIEPEGELVIDAWVKVTGTWVHPPGLGDMAKIIVDTIAVIPEPKEPYLMAPKD